MIGFRVDANEKIATGHMMRCIAIATECRRRGQECLFILAEDKETQRLKERGFAYHILNTKWDDMETERDKMKQLLQEKKMDWLIVDSYQATASYLMLLNQLVPVLYIDDMAEENYFVSALLHYSQWPEDRSYQEMYSSQGIKLLAGMQYAPLREEFLQEVKEETREESILITTGGTDTYNVTEKVLKSLAENEEFKNYKVHVIVGSLNQNKEDLRQIEEKDARIRLHENVKNMGEFMRKCKYAVSAGGTTLYELCACKIPTVCFSFADNQEGFTTEMGSHCIMIYAGDARRNEKIGEKIVEGLLSFLNNPEKEKIYRENMGQLVDGMGTQRIADFLCS